MDKSNILFSNTSFPISKLRRYMNHRVIHSVIVALMWLSTEDPLKYLAN